MNTYPIERLKPKVFCIGMHKTGTTSFGDALQMLGYRRHGWTGKWSPPLINAVMEGNFEKLFGVAYRFDVAEDLPWPFAFRQLDDHFPNAKFVLTTRSSPEMWLDSVSRHIKGDFVGHKLIYGYFRPHENPKAFVDKYNSHNAEVLEHFKGRPDKLLTMCFEHGDGWPELCRFLGLEGIPDTPFPHSNKNARGDQTEEGQEGGDSVAQA